MFRTPVVRKRAPTERRFTTAIFSLVLFPNERGAPVRSQG